jgi:putative membrane protein
VFPLFLAEYQLSLVLQSSLPPKNLTKQKRSLKKDSLEEKIALGIIALFHITGAAILQFSKGGLYQITLDLVPINLIFTALITFKYQSEYTAGFFKFGLLVFIFGIFIEMIGVNYGWIFGVYTYGEVLGYQIWNTPVLIGMNWLLLCYCSGALLEYLPLKTFLKWILSVGLLLSLDYFMEPVAMKNDFWTWENNSIPLQNYVGWAGSGAIFMLLYYNFNFPKKNRVAAGVWGIQFLFFLLQNIL